MKEHCVVATQNWVGQLHWKIGGHVWHSTHGVLNLEHEVLKGFSPGVSKQFSKTVAGSNIERVLNKITILWYKRKH